ncbi:MAG: biotin-dependent carboxyltransferase family protein [Woeseiaceae bacterium]|nr:biotin-dependent carboxyltransferase family protein [Woeseiaceae bacterium]
MTLTVLKPGMLTTLQSKSRIGMRHLGVPSGGAADSLSLALANKLVGNAWHETALEVTMLGPALRFDAACAFAIAGAPLEATLNSEPIACHATILAEPGDELVVGSASAGARSYIAIAGGFEADDVLGSTSTNLQAEFGGLEGRALQKGDILRFSPVETDALETPAEFIPPFTSSWALRACASLETELLEDADALFETNWTVGQRADRMGLQLESERLVIASDGRMASAGIFPGAIQCPQDGSPFLLSVDSGTVGGYPRVGYVAQVDRHMLGQLRPGDHVRLLRREPDEAIGELRAKIDYWREWLPDIEAILQ